MNKAYWVMWIKAAGIRALKTAAECALGVIGGSLIIAEIDWLLVGSASVIGAITSLLLSLKGLPEVAVPEIIEE